MIVFENPGEIDIRSISTFGISVKEGANPIGFFGTGLKYAIAVLLRTGHQVAIHSGLSVIEFGIQKDAVRGQSFEFVTMAVNGGEPVSIGFTTQLGKQWELWMAYREIACNCKDEAGAARYANVTPAAQAGQTRIIVTGEGFEAVFADADLYILGDQPTQTIGTTEIRNRRGNCLYYRGVRVMQLPRPSLYTYNLTAKLELTEDRTIKSQWDVYHRLSVMVLQAKDDRFIRTVVTAPEETLEGGLDFHGWSVEPSEQFIRTVGDCLSDRMMKVNSTAQKVWMDCTKQEFAPREIPLTAVQKATLERALTFCERIGFYIRDTYPIKVAESLGDGGLGLARDGTIFIAERAFHLGGTKQVASTLIEEYVHLRHGYADMTRELQSFLFEKLVSVGEELTGEPL
ncbi:MAG: hypothetical protein WC023_06350 [Rhodocyclaceae bacterium]